MDMRDMLGKPKTKPLKEKKLVPDADEASKKELFFSHVFSQERKEKSTFKCTFSILQKS